MSRHDCQGNPPEHRVDIHIGRCRILPSSIIFSLLKTQIPFHKPFTDYKEQEAISRSLKSGIFRGDGPSCQALQEILHRDTGARHVFLTTSCTHALEIALLALDTGPGDEIIMPSFTFVSSANAALLAGARVVFADICEDTLTLDPEDTACVMSSRTRSVIPVHYAGVSADMDALKKVCEDIPLIEDAAQGADAWYKKQHLGTLGLMGCLSFHDTKNITCGEGGALFTNNGEMARKVEVIREKGTNRSAFLRGEVDRYTWVARGSSYILSDLLASMLQVQWQKRDEIRQLRARAWHAYHEALKPFEEKGWIKRPVLPPHVLSNYHIYHILTCDEKHRNSLIDQFREAGIMATFHYVPLHNSPFGIKLEAGRRSLPVTEKVSASLIRLPLYPQIDQEFPDFAGRAADVVSAFFQNK